MAVCWHTSAGREAWWLGGSAPVPVGQVDAAARPPLLSSAASKRVGRHGEAPWAARHGLADRAEEERGAAWWTGGGSARVPGGQLDAAAPPSRRSGG